MLFAWIYTEILFILDLSIIGQFLTSLSRAAEENLTLVRSECACWSFSLYIFPEKHELTLSYFLLKPHVSTSNA